jgi:DNA-binding SARP family transcriptional activator
MLHLVTFGGLALESVNEAVAPRLSAQRLAILAVLAAEGDRRVSRERLTGLFWPDVDEERARHSLRQALYTLRQEVGREVVRSDVVLTLDPTAITSDVGAFRTALARGDRVGASRLVRGPFLDGFYLPSAAPFQRWVEEERARLQTAATGAIVVLAAEASAANDLDGAIAWWRQLTALDPISGRFALGYLKALAARGDRAEALDFARHHAALVRRELESDPDPDVQRIEAALRSMPAIPAVTGLADVAGTRPPLTDPARLPTVAPAAQPALGAQPAPAAAPGRRSFSQRVMSGSLTRVAVVASAVVAGIMLARVVSWPTPHSVRTSEASITGETSARRADVTTTSVTAYRLYEEGLRAYYRYNLAEARQLMHAALEDDSTFAMAAYYEALLTNSPASSAPFERAIRLAERASERERLVITVDLLVWALQSPRAVITADTLASRYPDDPRALGAVARARQSIGDWSGATRALQRALSIDSAAGGARTPCYLCEDYTALAEVYFWSDSLPAALRVAQQYAVLHPDWSRPWQLTFLAAGKMGDTAVARDAFRRYTTLHPSPKSIGQEVWLDLLLDRYENIERDLRPLLESARPADYYDARWYLLIGLRNQGRLRDARTLNETGRLPGFAAPQVSMPAPEVINQGLLALERGDARTAAATFVRSWEAPLDGTLAPGQAARYHAWRGALAGMAIAATGDTGAVLRMADTVEYWGKRSVFGRDPKLHHYLRGLVHVARGHDEDAIREFRDAIFSPTLGFTRVNLELGRALLRQHRAGEAVAAVAPALRGEIDASNLYVTRTELHELLAQAFDRAGQPDSAAVHFRAVATAWTNADEIFHARREQARAWVARHDRRQ